MLLLVVNTILMSVFLKKFVISLVSLPMYVNLVHFVFWMSCSLLLFLLLTLCHICYCAKLVSVCRVPFVCLLGPGCKCMLSFC